MGEDYRGFEPGRRPPIEVGVGRRWHPGELRAWIRRNGAWWAHVDYSLAEDGTHTATVPAHSIRWSDARAAPPGTGAGTEGSTQQA